MSSTTQKMALSPQLSLFPNSFSKRLDPKHYSFSLVIIDLVAILPSQCVIGARADNAMLRGSLFGPRCFALFRRTVHTPMRQCAPNSCYFVYRLKYQAHENFFADRCSPCCFVFRESGSRVTDWMKMQIVDKKLSTPLVTIENGRCSS